jgi:hypothetical protein
MSLVTIVTLLEGIVFVMDESQLGLTGTLARIVVLLAASLALSHDEHILEQCL